MTNPSSHALWVIGAAAFQMLIGGASLRADDQAYYSPRDRVVLSGLEAMHAAYPVLAGMVATKIVTDRAIERAIQPQSSAVKEAKSWLETVETRMHASFPAYMSDRALFIRARDGFTTNGPFMITGGATALHVPPNPQKAAVLAEKMKSQETGIPASELRELRASEKALADSKSALKSARAGLNDTLRKLGLRSIPTVAAKLRTIRLVQAGAAAAAAIVVLDAAQGALGGIGLVQTPPTITERGVKMILETRRGHSAAQEQYRAAVSSAMESDSNAASAKE